MQQPCAEDLSITSLKWAAAIQRLSVVPSIMWRSTSSLGKGLSLSSSNPEGFSCQACGRVYKLKSSLRNHQKWECGRPPQFHCPHCSYKAKQKMHIARHMERFKIHRQYPTHMYQFSYQTFSSVENSSLEVKKLYNCETCGKGYKWKESLLKHQRIECGKMPQFTCDICFNRFMHKHHLLKHKTAIHQMTPISTHANFSHSTPKQLQY
ncbi:zinc finger protein 595-like [Leptopilina boulardi]|uniref:zinc finger protein 595-like n=1 Tax=Leptopilina boulardi TaxID=63433 RepID=UPI0021F57467|nr:zinc finger protein 595-like [Leptopilina boulardi]